MNTRQASSCSPPERSGRGAPAVDDECPAGMCRVTIREVAGQARVPLGTVSNVLNGPHLVAAETRQRVLEVIDQIGLIRSSAREASFLRMLQEQRVQGVVTTLWGRLNRYRPGGGRTILSGKAENNQASNNPGQFCLRCEMSVVGLPAAPTRVLR